MKGIVKKFGDIVANDHVNFTLNKGEIHALLGENGAGKTTLMNILYGLYKPDEGAIYINGSRVEIKSPKDAIKYGIGMVHQHPRLVTTLTIAENIALSLREVNYLSSLSRVKDLVSSFSRKYGLRVDPDAKIWQLSYSEQQKVEILRELIKGATILILDEPTAMLTSSERDELFKALREMVKEGKSIIFITHKLEEALSISDRITVLRKGKVVASLSPREVDEKTLAKLMIGYEVKCELDKPKAVRGRRTLLVDKIRVLNDRGVLAVKDISFEVFEGEVFGIAGVAGNGQKELVEAITGLRKVEGGIIKLFDVDITNGKNRDFVDLNLAHIPENRIQMGVVLDLSVEENLILRRYKFPPFSKGIALDYRAISSHAKKLIEDYDIVTKSEKDPAKFLSGGNIQRLILARELSWNPRLIIAYHPTYGLDVAATSYIRSMLLSRRNEGAAILLISEDLDEIVQMSDRIAVMYEGEILGIMNSENLDINKLELMIGGVRP
ncbi:MAG: heme ABC transporter ATP-binding protein [Candidatus Methanomethylicota archaeon]|uniref:Heme ABC transporter ATP-binding protein n=1 Tax=Thermoproteota archaeon TaxID=2056631 RepID=A0A497ERJ0_9CREN|nr:MAG: heme ABC transporter ATP-binding protein [Candidatus Verstraetearchaeota archaeon]RLE53118.1 MAG: heme ABC transporter ATP-binding protein [Candidatus Verstraetearchaeota archaeon]